MSAEKDLIACLSGSRVGTHENCEALVAEMLDLFHTLQSMAPHSEAIAILKPHSDPQLKEVMDVIVSLARKLETLSPEQRESWPLRGGWVEQVIESAGAIAQDSVNTKGARIENVVLLMAEIWERHFRSWPSSGEDGAFYGIFCTLMPEELQVSPKTLRTVLRDLQEKRNSAAKNS